jgi:hypothetical protein
MATTPQTDPYGPLAIIAGCAAGAVIGGILDGVLSDRGGWFSAFGAAFGLMIGGLIGAAVHEFGRPVMGVIVALMPSYRVPTAPVPEPAAAIAPALDPNRPSLAGRVLQALAAFVTLVGGFVLLWWLARPIAHLIGLPMFMVLPIGLLLVGAAVTTAWHAGATLAAHFDLTAE